MYLIEQHATRRIPSAFMLAKDTAYRDHGPFLALGDGVYNTADERWRPAHFTWESTGFSSFFAPSGTAPALQLPRLVSSTYEIESSAAAWSTRGRSILLTGTRASRQSLIAALDEKPAVIHIASHVLYPGRRPRSPLIDLGLTVDGAPDVLTTKDVTGLHAGGALVVVSGCSSAAAHAVRGAGIMGLTRAWLLAGASAVVGSRWPVQDDTKDLFRSFYAHLAAPVGSPGPGSALQQAQLQMLHSGTWRSDPRYWGAFYLLTKD